MKYMTFNSSCSYAGVANMLEKYGIDTEDRQIALDMGLPFLFSCEDGTYCSGPMLQTAQWFNLYLQPKGLCMTETRIPREEVFHFLENSRSAMLGLSLSSRGKHAVVYMGTEDGCRKFLNNKSRESAEPETIFFSDKELLSHLSDSVVIATLREISPLAIDLKPYFQTSIAVLLRLKQDIRAFCGREQTPQAIRTAQNTLFRAILLDGITMLELLGNEEPRETLKSVQREFLAAFRENSENRELILGDRISVNSLEKAIDAYIELIREHIAVSAGIRYS